MQDLTAAAQTGLRSRAWFTVGPARPARERFAVTSYGEPTGTVVYASPVKATQAPAS